MTIFGVSIGCAPVVYQRGVQDVKTLHGPHDYFFSWGGGWYPSIKRRSRFNTSIYKFKYNPRLFDTDLCQCCHQAAVTIMENCIRDIRQWMLHDRLLINDAKSEFLIIGSKQQIGDAKVFPTTCVRNLGSWFDSELTMNTHINKACSAAFFHLHNIKRISQFLTQDSLLKLIHAFVTSRLDYCNSLLYGLPKSHIAKLQRVQNAAARIVTNTHRFEHITPIICQLHWLPVSYRINFKILLLTFKVLHGLSPKWSVVAERSSLPDSSSGVSNRMWVRIPAVTLVSLSKTLNHNCFSPPRG